MQTDITQTLLLIVIIIIIIMFIFILIIWKGKSGEERKRIMNVKRTYRNIFGARRRERLNFLLVTNFTKVTLIKDVLSAGNNMITGIVLETIEEGIQEKGQVQESLPEPIKVPFDFWSRIISENAVGFCYGTFFRTEKKEESGDTFYQGNVSILFNATDLAEIVTAKELIDTLTKKSFDDLQYKYKTVEDAYKLAADVSEGMGKNTEQAAYQLGRIAFYNKQVPIKFIEGFAETAKDNKSAMKLKEILEKMIGDLSGE